MKKIYGVVLILLLLIVSAFLLKGMWEQKRFNGDYKTLEQEIFEKDTNGKGYSDVVENKITHLTTDPNLQHSLRKLAKATRDELRAKTQGEYTTLSIKSLRQLTCAYYVGNKLDIESAAITESAYDNSEMRKYSEYLNLMRFASRQSQDQITDWMNDKTNHVNSQEDYEKHCR